MGVPLKTAKRRESGRCMQVPGSKAGGAASQALRGLILHGHTPEPHRPPRILPKAEHRGVAASLFSFERDPHARRRQPCISKS